MIDLMRTRDNMDPYTAGCAQLLAAVIADAIKCASTEPRQEEKAFKTNMNWQSCDAARSIWFLFDDNSPFDVYATFIGMDAAAVREALLDPNKRYKPQSDFSWTQAEIIRLRFQWYRQLKNRTANYEKQMLKLPQRDQPNQFVQTKKKKEEFTTTRDVWQYASQQGEKNDDTNPVDQVPREGGGGNGATKRKDNTKAKNSSTVVGKRK